MPDEGATDVSSPNDEEQAQELEGALGTVLKSLFGRAPDEPDDAEKEESREPAPPADETSEQPEGDDSVLHLVLDRVNGRLEGDVEATETTETTDEAAAPEETAEPVAAEREGSGDVSDQEVREETVEAQPEPAGVPTGDDDVLARLTHPSVEERIGALTALRGNPGQVSSEAVADRLLDPDPSARELAVEVLGEAEDDAVLLRLLDAMHDPADQVRHMAREVFERRRSDSLVRLLRQEMSDPKHGRAAASLLADLGELDLMIRAMADADPETRAMVREVLDEVGVTDRLIADLGDPHPDLRRSAAERLGTMRAGRAIGDLAQRLQDPDTQVRVNAAGALGEIGDASAISALKQALVSDPNPDVVEALVRALRRLAPSRG